MWHFKTNTAPVSKVLVLKYLIVGVLGMIKKDIEKHIKKKLKSPNQYEK